MSFNYSSIDNRLTLDTVSTMWTMYYNMLINLPYSEDWEIKVYENQIKAEKVFDI